MPNSSSKILKDTLQTRFNEVYKDKRLLAIHLNGFSHSVIFDDGAKESEIEAESFSAYAPEQSWSKKAEHMFKDVPHHSYQNNAKEIVFVDRDKR